MDLRNRIKTILSEYKLSASSQINEIDWEDEPELKTYNKILLF